MILKKLFLNLKDSIRTFSRKTQDIISTFIKSQKGLFHCLFLYLDFSTRVVSIFLQNIYIYVLLSMSLLLMPVFFNAELLKYYEYLSETGFSFKNVILAIFKFLPFPFMSVYLLLLFLIFIVFLMTPLLSVFCLTDHLKKKIW